jgi:hypothetical protein
MVEEEIDWLVALHDARERIAHEEHQARLAEQSGGRATRREFPERTTQQTAALRERFRGRAQHEVNVREQGAGHAGTREHDAEAKLLEQISADLPDDARGEIHLETNFPTCPSCIEMLYRFQKTHRNVRVIVHSPTGR